MTIELRVSFCFAQIASLLNCYSIVDQETGICETKCAKQNQKRKIINLNGTILRFSLDGKILKYACGGDLREGNVRLLKLFFCNAVLGN